MLQTLCLYATNTLFARQKHFVPTLGILCSHVGNILFPCWELFLTDNLPALFLSVHIRALLNNNAFRGVDVDAATGEVVQLTVR